MEQKRFVSFIVLSMAILIGWKIVVEPRLPWAVKPKPVAQKPGDNEKLPDKAAKPIPPEKGAAKDAQVARGPADDEGAAAKPDDKDETPATEKPEVEKPAVEKIATEQPPALKLPAFPAKTVELGSADPASSFRQLATLTSHGAAVEKIELNDPRYKALPKPHPPLAIVGSDEVQPYSLSMTVPQFEKLDADLARLNWELVEVLPADPPYTEAKFRLTIDNLEVVKHYTLGQVDPAVKGREEASAYELYVDLSFRNLADKSQIVNYVLQGPTGLPLENVDNTQKFRDVVVGFVAGPGAVKHASMAGKTIAEGKAEVWSETPFDYIGVDVQYFAALLSPKVDQRETRYVRSATQTLIGLPAAERSEVSVALTSVDLDLEAAGDKDGRHTITHSYKLFAGPKRDDVLPVGAEKVVDFGMFHWISRPMLALLKAFHALFGSWGVAIICLTIIVRSALFPLSIKQARGAAKMQELQPEIAALKEKYGKDKEKMARAQMELFSKHQYNPLAGCLPVFLQLPIFMGLYQALNNAVDLRMAKFLYIQNLAAPDALFQLPFVMPFFGWKEFNLLPLITIALFIFQQKMFMPPPQNEEQAMQQKMMNFMMLFMGVMFYKVPAGLCVYFIASSTWGMAERKLLPKAKPRTAPPADSAGGAGGSGGASGFGGGSSGSGPRKPQGNGDSDRDEGNGFIARILKAADKQTSARKAPQGKRK